MTKRGLIARIPIWVRVPGVIALVLAGIVISAMLLDTSGGGHGRPGDDTDRGGHSTSDNGPPGRSRGHGPGEGDMDPDSGGHGSGERERSGHNQGKGEPATPATRDLAAATARVVTFAMNDIAFAPVTAEVRREGRA